MRINVKTKITGYDAKAITQSVTTDNEGVEHKIPLTLGDMMIVALNSVLETEKNLDAITKVARAVLSQDIYNAGKSDKKDGSVIDIERDQIEEIKKLMNSNYGPLLIMRAFEIFDPKVEEIKKAK